MIKINGFLLETYYTYPDKTPLMELTDDIINSLVGQLCSTITWLYEDISELVYLQFVIKQIQNYFPLNKLCLEMPYLPCARQDRAENTPKDLPLLKYMGEIINSMDFAQVIILDPHSSVAQNVLNKVEILSPIKEIEHIYQSLVSAYGQVLLFFPDEGSMKRYGSACKQPYCFGVKHRDWETGRIESLEVSGKTELIKDSAILIVDDICSKGGTFRYAAKKLKELGCGDIYLWVTHCEDTIQQGNLLVNPLIKKIFTTDSICHVDDDKIHKISYTKFY